MIDSINTGVPAMVTGNSGDGFGTGGGGIIMLVILIALFGCGGFGGNRGNDAARETQLINDNMNSRFSSLEGMNEARFMAQANNINHVEAMESSRDNMREICETKGMVQSVGYQNGLIEKDTQNQIGIGLKDVELKNLECCCKTQTSIADAKSEILSAIKANEIQALRDKLYEVQNGLSNCNQTAAIINAVRPPVNPCYVTYNPQQSFFPPQPSVPAATAYGGAANGIYGF